MIFDRFEVASVSRDLLERELAPFGPLFILVDPSGQPDEPRLILHTQSDEAGIGLVVADEGTDRTRVSIDEHDPKAKPVSQRLASAFLSAAPEPQLRLLGFNYQVDFRMVGDIDPQAWIAKAFFSDRLNHTAWAAGTQYLGARLGIILDGARFDVRVEPLLRDRERVYLQVNVERDITSRPSSEELGGTFVAAIDGALACLAEL